MSDTRFIIGPLSSVSFLELCGDGLHSPPVKKWDAELKKWIRTEAYDGKVLSFRKAAPNKNLKTLWEEAEFEANLFEQDAEKAREAYSCFFAMCSYFDAAIERGKPTDFDYTRRRALNEFNVIAQRITDKASVARIRATEAHKAYLAEHE